MERKSVDLAPAELIAESAGIVNWRLLFKTVIKKGILLGRSVQAVGQGVYEEADKLVMEAKAELEKNENTKAGASHAGGPN